MYYTSSLLLILIPGKNFDEDVLIPEKIATSGIINFCKKKELKYFTYFTYYKQNVYKHSFFLFIRTKTSAGHYMLG